MKKTLKEQLERIHVLTYGKLNEDNFINSLLNPTDTVTKKVDDPKKADLVSQDVADFYKSLDDAAETGGLKQQQRGSMAWQKGVESMQIGLMMLGYDLPKYGVDGLFGPETAVAVNKFTEDNVKAQTNENVKVVASGANSLIGGPGQGTHDAGDWQSRNAWDVTGNEHSQVFSITNGTISKIRKGTGGIVKSNGKIIYGDQVTVTSDSGPDVFYTHIDCNLSVNDKVMIGGVIGTIIAPGGMPPHVHIGLSTGNISDFADINGKAAGGVIQNTTATPEMLRKESEMLRAKGVTSETLKPYLDTISSGGSADFTDVDLTTDEGYRKYSEICNKFIQTRQPNPLGVTGEMMAKGAKNAFVKYHKYVPPELALAQLAVEGGIGNGNENSRPIKTKNPFNVGNTDNGDDIYHQSVEDGIETYYELIARKYLGKGKTAKDLVQNFVNQAGDHYATAGTYEKAVNQIAAQANRIAKTVG